MIDISANYFKGLLTKPQIVDTNRFRTNIQSNLSRSAVEASVGQIFEAGIKSSISTLSLSEIANFDLDAGELGRIRSRFKLPYEFSGTSFADLKNSLSAGNLNSMAAKIDKYENPLKKSKALGFIPNYSPLMTSMIREISAGVSPSSIRVGQDSRLSSSENPMGLGVYNTKDEPSGLGQGIARFKDIFAARKSGAAKGFVPNYATRAFDSDYRQKVLNSRGLTTGGNKVPFGQGGGALAGSILLPTITGAVSSAMSEENIVGRGISSGLGNIGSYALTGAALGGGTPGAIIGGLFGAATTLIDIQKQFDEKPFKDLEKAIQSSQEKLNSLNDSFIKFNGISEKLNQAYTGNIRLSTQELQKLQTAQVAALSSLPAETRNAILEALGKGDTLEVQRIETDALELQQSNVKAQQAEQAAEALKLTQKPGFMDYFNAMSSETFATPSEIRQEYLKNNPEKIQKQLSARQTELQQFAGQRLEGGQSIGDVITKLSSGGAKPEEIRSKLLGLKSQFTNVALYAEYIKDFDIQGFLDTLNKAEETKNIIETNARRVKDTAKGFLDSLENNIFETNRIFSEGETNIANVTAQIQSRRGTFLESIKDLFGEFTQLNVSQQFDDAIRNAEYERSRLQITQKVTGSLSALGGGAIENFRLSPAADTGIVSFIDAIQENIDNLKSTTNLDELRKKSLDLASAYDQLVIDYSTGDDKRKDAAQEFANQLRNLNGDISDTQNKLNALSSTTENSKRIADQEYAAREKLLRVQQAISFAGGIRSYQQNAFPGMTQDFNNARMNLGSSNVGVRGRGALGILDQLKQLGIGPTSLPSGLVNTAQTGLEADLQKYLSSIGQNLSKEQIGQIAKTQIQNYAKQDQAIEAQATNIPKIDTAVSDIYKQLSQQGIKIDSSSINELAQAVNGVTIGNQGTITGQPTNTAGAVMSGATYTGGLPSFSPTPMGQGPFYRGKLFNELQTKPSSVGALSPSETVLNNTKDRLENLKDLEQRRGEFTKQIEDHYIQMAAMAGDTQQNEKVASENRARDLQVINDKSLNAVQITQKLIDLHTRDNQLAERRLKFRQAEIDRMNDLADLADGYLTSVEYANKELERQQNAARTPGYNPAIGIATNFVNAMSYNGTQFFQDLNTSAVDVANNIQESFSNAFQSFASGTVSAGDAFKNFGIQVLQQIQQIATQISTKLFMGAIFGQFQGALGGMGGGGGLGSLFGFSKGGAVKGYAGGGYVNGGSGLIDDVPAVLSKGEFVLNQRAVKSLQQAYGPGFLHSLNAGATRGMADGGGFSKNFNNEFAVSGIENTSGLNTKDMQSGLNALDTYINQLKGENNVDPALSNYALSDADSIKNQERMQKEVDYKDYIGYLMDSYNQNTATMVSAQQAYAKELDAYNRQQKQMLQSAWMSAIMGIAGGAMMGFGGGMGGGLFGPKASSFAMPGGMGGTSSALGGSYGAITSLYGGAQKATGFSSLFSSQNLPMLGMLGAGTIGSPFLQNMLRGSGTSYASSSGRTSSGLTTSNRFRFANGGMAEDDIPALLMGGEFVVNKNAVKKYGTGFFEKLNNGQVRGFADGGQVGNAVLGGGTESTLNIDILTTAISDLNETLKNQKDIQSSSAGDTNNITIQISMEADGKTTENSQDNSNPSDQNDENKNSNKAAKEKNMKEFTQLIKQNVISTIIEQKRPGGLLSKTSQS